MRIKPLMLAIGFAVFSLAFLTGLTSSAEAQDRGPIVHFSVTFPDGRTEALNAPESGLARASAKEGVAYGFRPTMIDDEGAQVVITIFDMGNASAAARELGEVQLRKGGSAMTSKTTPSFKVKLEDVRRTTT